MDNVLVTGGSRGIGLAIAKKLAASGYGVIAVARRRGDALEAAIEACKGQASGSLHFAALDLADIEAIPEFIRRLRRERGPIYGLVNNAAIGTEGLLATMPNSEIEALLRLNNLSPIVLTKYLARSMMADGGGRVVNVSSITAFTGYSGLSVYSATKASLIGFTRSLAREVGRTGVTVNAVAPGFVDTDMTRELTDEHRQQIMRRSALRRLADVEDVANAVEFLLSDRAKNITGTVVTVDAGSTA